MKSDYFTRHADALRAASVCACAMMLLLAALAAFRPELFSPQVTATAADVTGQEAIPAAEQDAVMEFELEREQLRSMQMAQLNDIVHGEGTDEETKLQAQRRLLNLSQWMENEKTIEGVLRMRGYEDAICTVHEDSVNVIIRAEAVGRQESAVIYELVLRETGVTGGNVKIIPVSG